MLSHNDVIDKIKEYGHPTNREGMCFGIALMGLQAILLKDTDTLQKRFKLLSQIPTEQLLERIKVAERCRAELHNKARKAVQAEWHEEIKSTDEKIAFEKRLNSEKRREYYQVLSAKLIEADQELKEEELLLLSIPAYLEGIAIYFHPHKYPLFEKEYDIIVTDEKMEPKVNQIILTLGENSLLRCKLISKGNVTEIPISQEELENALGKDEQKKFNTVLKSKDTAKLKSYIPNIVNILSKTDPLLEKDPGTKKQNAVLTFPRLLPAALMEQKTKAISTPLVQKAATYSGAYDQKELSTYFNVLAEKLKEYEIMEPVALLLNTSNHSITVSWEHKTQSWRLVDANKLNLFDKTMIADELAEKVMTGFSKNGITTFCTEVYAVKAITSQVQSTMNACQKDERWQAIHAVDAEKAQTKDSYNASWLHIATHGGEIQKIEQLLEANADVNLASNDSLISLNIAAENGHIEVVKHLLEAKANVNLARSKDSITSLYIAAENGHIEVVKHLLEAKADVNLAISKDSVTSLYIAAENGHIEVVKHLLEANADVNLAKKEGGTSLYIAAQNGHIEVVKHLLEANADVNLANTGATPLYITTQKGYIEIVKLLLEKKADINKAENYKLTALCMAIERDHAI